MLGSSRRSSTCVNRETFFGSSSVAGEKQPGLEHLGGRAHVSLPDLVDSKLLVEAQLLIDPRKPATGRHGCVSNQRRRFVRANASVPPRWKLTPMTPPRPYSPTSNRRVVTGPVSHVPAPLVFAR